MQSPQLDYLVQLDYNNGSRDREKLSRGNLYRSLFFVMEYSLTLAAADNDQQGLARGDALAAINELELKVSGNNTIKAYPGPMIPMINYHQFGQTPRGHYNELGNGNADPSVKVGFLMPFWKPDALEPFQFSFDSTDWRNVSIRVDWNDATDINAAASWNTEPSLDVYAKTAEASELRAERGPLAFSLWKETYEELQIQQASENHFVKLPFDDLVTGIHVNMLDDGVASGPGFADAPDLLNSLEIGNQNDTPIEATKDVMELCLPTWEGRQLQFNGQTYTDLMLGDDNDVDGHSFYKNPDDGLQSESFAPKQRNMSELKTWLDTDNPSGNGRAIVKTDTIKTPNVSSGNGNGNGEG